MWTATIAPSANPKSAKKIFISDCKVFASEPCLNTDRLRSGENNYALWIPMIDSRLLMNAAPERCTQYIFNGTALQFGIFWNIQIPQKPDNPLIEDIAAITNTDLEQCVHECARRNFQATVGYNIQLNLCSMVSVDSSLNCILKRVHTTEWPPQKGPWIHRNVGGNGSAILTWPNIDLGNLWV